MQNFSGTSVAATGANGTQCGVSGAHNQLLLPQHAREYRREDRYRVTWKVAVAVNGQIYGEKMMDISLHGAAILSEHNLKPETYVTLNIHVPLLASIGAPKILTVRGITTYSVHDAAHLCFRIGINFVEFELPSDRTYLEERLKNYHSNNS